VVHHGTWCGDPVFESLGEVDTTFLFFAFTVPTEIGRWPCSSSKSNGSLLISTGTKVADLFLSSFLLAFSPFLPSWTKPVELELNVGNWREACPLLFCLGITCSIALIKEVNPRSLLIWMRLISCELVTWTFPVYIHSKAKRVSAAVEFRSRMTGWLQGVGQGVETKTLYK